MDTKISDFACVIKENAGFFPSKLFHHYNAEYICIICIKLHACSSVAGVTRMRERAGEGVASAVSIVATIVHRSGEFLNSRCA